MKKLILSTLFLLLSVTVFSNSAIDLHYNKLYLEEKLELLNKENQEFKKALASSESNLDYNIVNSIGAIGAWQFMPYTLKDLGYDSITVAKFKENPNIFPKELQEHVLNLKIKNDLKLLTNQWWRGSTNVNYLEKYVGKEIYGVKISLAGIIAACHLGGAGGVIKFFDSHGVYNPKDTYGTSLFSYMSTFSKYNYNYKEINQINNKIACLEDSLEKSIHSYGRLNIFLSDLHLKDTETVLTLNSQRTQSLMSTNLKSYIYHLDLKLNYQNIIEEYLHSEVQLHQDIILICQEDMVKLNGIIKMNGKELLRYFHHHHQLYQKTQDCSNFILSQFGMLHGMLSYLTSFQYIGLKKLTNFPHLGVV